MAENRRIATAAGMSAGNAADHVTLRHIGDWTRAGPAYGAAAFGCSALAQAARMNTAHQEKKR